MLVFINKGLLCYENSEEYYGKNIYSVINGNWDFELDKESNRAFILKTEEFFDIESFEEFTREEFNKIYPDFGY
jgi:hypothetical protein